MSKRPSAVRSATVSPEDPAVPLKVTVARDRRAHDRARAGGDVDSPVLAARVRVVAVAVAA